MERNINGIPNMNDTCALSDGATLNGKPLAYAYVPIQQWKMLYSTDEALAHGTLFEELYMPMEVYGNE